jgi:hypothetical protein
MPGGGVRVFDGTKIRATFFGVQGSRKLVALFSYHRPETGFLEPSSSQFFSDQGWSQIFIHVDQNDYYLNDELPQARRALRRFTKGYWDVRGMGFSMGAFGCLALARALRMRQAVLVSPIRLGFPHHGPYPAPDLTAECAVFDPYGDWLGGLPDDLRGVILYDPWMHNGRDQAYARTLAMLLPQVHPLAFPGGGHPATRGLTAINRFGALQKLLLLPVIQTLPFKSLYRQVRMDQPDYLAKLSGRLLSK